MQILKYFFGIALIGLLFSSCGPTLKPFTKNMYEDYGWSERDLQHVQFYLSQNIVLKRKANEHESIIKEGKIKLTKGKKVEKIVIKKGTPGTLTFIPKANRFAISFDQDENKYLMFGPNKRAHGKFVLLAKDWDRNIGHMTYNGELFYTSSSSAMAHLLVDIKQAAEVKYSREKATGRIVN